ncbi:hypothetical protein QBC34DRAFT_420408 [Podospora aff. communis PSN243]|uniref:Saccharopine dehydrogenase-like C-terminal domain-containing protein n=1 Tax=Podospora aff. communis PSN243 TaxID=3040156 RepID=A0AAV9H4J6_9PEZI|nr:hypothetical protein QBC34DRAFT_420408 [Podospora aff. communis PSN243]
MATAEESHVMDGYKFVAYPNRDWTPFRKFYVIPGARSVIRGSLLYKGNPAMEWLKEGVTWAEVQQRATGARFLAEEDLICRVNELCECAEASDRVEILEGLRWMGLLSNEKVTPRHGNLVDTISARLEKLCSLEPGELDLVMLQHKFVMKWMDGFEETITSTLKLFGEPGGYSAMSKSVGVTFGTAIQMLLDGFGPMNQRGVVVKYTKEIYGPPKGEAGG